MQAAAEDIAAPDNSYDVVSSPTLEAPASVPFRHLSFNASDDTIAHQENVTICCGSNEYQSIIFVCATLHSNNRDKHIHLPTNIAFTLS